MLEEIFGISSYILMAILGFAAAFLTGFLRRKIYGYEKLADLFAMLIVGIAGLLVGSRLLFIVTMIPEIVKNFGWEVINNRVINGGLVFYGGLLGAMYGMHILAKAMKRDSTQILNFTIPCFAAFHMFGRIGCLLDGCCYGVEWEHGVACDGGFLCFPIQLVEAIGIALILVALLLLERYGIKKGKNFPLVHIYFILYGVLRFVDEFWRGDVLRGVTEIKIDYYTSAQNSASLAFSISTSQIISLILIVFSSVYLIRLWKKNREKATVQVEESTSAEV